MHNQGLLSFFASGFPPSSSSLFFSRPDNITRTGNSMVPTPFQMLFMVMMWLLL